MTEWDEDVAAYENRGPAPSMVTPAAEHNCRRVLPDRPGGYGSTGVPDGTVAGCPLCGRLWVSLPCYESYGPTEKWYPVHWWNRRRIRLAREAGLPVRLGRQPCT